MGRAILAESLIDTAGNVLSGATVTVYEPNTTTPITATLYADDTGLTTLTNPLTADARGRFQAYLTLAQRVDLYIQAPGMTPTTIPDVAFLDDPANVAHRTGSETLTQKTLSSPTINGGTIDGATLTDPIWLNPELTGLDVLDSFTVRDGAGGTVLMEVLPSLIRFPTTPVVFGASAMGDSQLAVYSGTTGAENVSPTRVNALFVLSTFASGGVANDVSALSSFAFNLGGGFNHYMRGHETHSVKAAGDAAFPYMGLEVSSSSTIAGNGDNRFLGYQVKNLPRTFGIEPLYGTGQVGDAAMFAGEDERGWHYMLRFKGNADDGTVSTIAAYIAGRTESDRLFGDIMAAARVFSTGLGGTKVGLLDHSLAGTGETFAGLNYHTGTNRLRIGAYSQGVGYRDVAIAPLGGTLRVGVNQHTVWLAPQLAVGGGDQTLTATPTDVTNLAINLGRTGYYKVEICLNANWNGVGDNGQIIGGLLATSGGTAVVTGASLHGYGVGQATDWQMLTQQYIVQVTVPTVTVKAQAFKAGGSGTSAIRRDDSSISAVWLGEP